jgi:D-aminoacyl-tRNA deacylase
MRLILYSMDDLAGSNIARLLINRYNFSTNGEYYYGSPIYQKKDVLLFGTHSSVRDLEALPFNPDVCLVASRHRSESGKPTLTCHPTGNYGRADLGGKDGTLQLTHAHYLRQCLLLLRSVNEKYGLGYEVSMEVTHHGPTGLPFPLLYVEVGSTKEQWSDENACNAVAETIYEALFLGAEVKPSAVGFGGPHYAPNFNEVSSHYAVGHIMPKHAVEYLTKTMVQEMFEKTAPRPDVAIIDWKGLKGAEKDVLQAILDELGINWVKTSELKRG